MRNKAPSVLHLIDTMNIGGAERIALTLVNLFSIRNHKIGILIIQSGEYPLLKEIDRRANIYILNRKNKYNPLKCREVALIIQNYDIIHVHMRHNLRYLWFSSFFSLFKWKNFFFHDHYGNIKNNRKIDFITKYIISKSIYIGVSNELCQWSIEQCKNKKTYQLNNIILKEKKINKNYSSSKGNRLILVSNIHPRKNIEFAIRIMHELNKSGEFYLDIIGKKIDRKYSNKLFDMIISYDLEEYIKFNEKCDNIQKILYDYDLALHPSKSETGPLVLIEYLSQSIPFLAYNTGEVAQQVKNKFPSFIIDNFDLSIWIKKIKILLNYEKKIISKKMENFFLNKFSEEKYYNKCQNIYQKNFH